MGRLLCRGHIVACPQALRQQVVRKPQGRYRVIRCRREVVTVWSIPRRSPPFPAVMNRVAPRIVRPIVEGRPIIITWHVAEVEGAPVRKPVINVHIRTPADHIGPLHVHAAVAVHVGVLRITAIGSRAHQHSTVAPGNDGALAARATPDSDSIRRVDRLDAASGGEPCGCAVGKRSRSWPAEMGASCRVGMARAFRAGMGPRNRAAACRRTGFDARRFASRMLTWGRPGFRPCRRMRSRRRFRGGGWRARPGLVICPGQRCNRQNQDH